MKAKNFEEIISIALPEAYNHQTKIDIDRIPKYGLQPLFFLVSAFLEISKKTGKDLDKCAQDYYIHDISPLEKSNIDVDNEVERDRIFKEAHSDRKIIYKNAFDHVKNSKKPAFLGVGDKGHYVLLALVPNNKNNKLNLVYLDSFGFENIVYGKQVVEEFLQYIKDQKADLESDICINKSVSQQYSMCCSLSVASNIASIASHHHKGKDIDTLKESLFVPKDDNEKQKYYNEMGMDLVGTLSRFNDMAHRDLINQKNYVDDYINLIIDNEFNGRRSKYFLNNNIKHTNIPVAVLPISDEESIENSLSECLN